jgi:pilus assembly protein Flp/PilA
MERATSLAWRIRFWRDENGQDLIEYALMAGFLALVGGAFIPGYGESISTIFSKIGSVMDHSSPK